MVERLIDGTITDEKGQFSLEKLPVIGEFNLALSDPAPTGGITVNYTVDNSSTASTSDREAFYKGLERSGPKAVREFMAAGA